MDLSYRFWSVSDLERSDRLTCVSSTFSRVTLRNGLCAAAISSPAGGVEALKSKQNYDFDKIRLSSSMLVGLGK